MFVVNTGLKNEVLPGPTESENTETLTKEDGLWGGGGGVWK